MVWGKIFLHYEAKLVCIQANINQRMYISQVLKPVVRAQVQNSHTASDAQLV